MLGFAAFSLTPGLRERVAKRHVNQTVISRFLLKISNAHATQRSYRSDDLAFSSHSRHATIETARGGQCSFPRCLPDFSASKVPSE